jgi:hypothetical protein
MITEILQQSAVTIALLAVCLVAVLMVVTVSAHAYRQGRLLHRWNSRNSRDIPLARVPRRRRPRWAARRTA